MEDVVARSKTTSGTYDAAHIEELEGLTAVRKRPGMYIGSTDGRGLQHCLWEIIDNAVDEAIAGWGTSITVTLHADGSAEVADEGRGIPVADKDGTPAVIVVLTRLHAGAKFGTGGYKVTGGLHGVGASAVNALSRRMEVTVVRDGARWRVAFERGVPGHFDAKGFRPSDKLVKAGRAPKSEHGTTVRFWPDPQVFTEDADFDWDGLVARAHQTACLVPGLRINVVDARQDPAVRLSYHATGLSDLIAERAGDDILEGTRVVTGAGQGTYNETVPVLQDGAWVMTDTERTMEVELALRWGDGFERDVVGYANIVETPGGGTHVAGFERALVKVMTSEIAKRKMLRSGEPAPGREDVCEGLTAVVAVRLPEPQFEGQTKEILGTPAAKDIAARVTAEVIETWMNAPRQGRAVKAVLTKIVEASRLRRALREKRATVRRKNALEGSALPDKLKDCRNASATNSELIIVEGTSALGTVSAARDSTFQALLPIRGKILNVARASERAMLDNVECAEIISALGGGSGSSFDITQVRYGRLIILTDADVDGSHIRCLLLTLLWRYMRPFVEAGRVYAGVPPLYRLVVKGRDDLYCYTSAQRDAMLVELSEAGVAVDHTQRFKGLGEMSVGQMALTTLDPATRMLRQVSLDDLREANALIGALMGDDASARREWIAEHSDVVDPSRLDV